MAYGRWKRKDQRVPSWSWSKTKCNQKTIFDEGEVWAGMLKKVTDRRYAGVTREEVPRSEVMLKDGILDERMRPGESIVAKVSCRLTPTF